MERILLHNCRALLMEAGCELALAERRELPQGDCWAVLRGLWN